MCGSNSEQKDTYNEQKQMMDTLNQAYASAYSNNQSILGALTKVFTPILNAGPMQEGMAPADVNAQRTMASDTIARNYAQAQKATADILASQGGGNSFLPSGANDVLLAQNANAAAAQNSSAQNDITKQNYAMGYQNWMNSANVLNTLAGQYNPLGYAGSQISAGNSAATSANNIAMAANSPWNAAIGAVGAIGGAALGNVGGIASMMNSGMSNVGKVFSNWSAGLNNPLSTISSNTGGLGMIPSVPQPSFGAGV